MIRFACPSCWKALSAPEERAGAPVACPSCGLKLQVPETTASIQSVPQATNKGRQTDGPEDGNPFTNMADGEPLEADNYELSAVRLGCTIPPEIEAEVSQLGRVLRTFGTNYFTTRSIAGWGFLAGGLAVCILVAIVRGKTVPMLGMPLVFFPVAAIFLLPLFFGKYGVHVVAMQKGFVRIQRGDAQVFRWDQIAYVTYQVYSQTGYGQGGVLMAHATHHHLSISGPNGEDVDFDQNLAGIERFAAIVKQEVERAGGRVLVLDSRPKWGPR